MNLWIRRALLLAAIILVLLPLVEIGDHWENYGSDPEFVHVITVAAVCLGLVLFRREIAIGLRRLLIVNVILREALRVSWASSPLVQDNSPPIRAPIRI